MDLGVPQDTILTCLNVFIAAFVKKLVQLTLSLRYPDLVLNNIPSLYNVTIYEINEKCFAGSKL